MNMPPGTLHIFELFFGQWLLLFFISLNEKKEKAMCTKFNVQAFSLHKKKKSSNYLWGKGIVVDIGADFARAVAMLKQKGL